MASDFSDRFACAIGVGIGTVAVLIGLLIAFASTCNIVDCDNTKCPPGSRARVVRGPITAECICEVTRWPGN